MPPYHELVLACNLKENAPQQVIDILHFMATLSYDEEILPEVPFPVPQHPFFRYDTWMDILTSDSDYLAGESFARLTKDEMGFYKLTLRAKVRGSNLMVGAFLHWLAPYSETEGFVGHTYCDESPDYVDLIYFENATVHYQTVIQHKGEWQVKIQKIQENGTVIEE